MYTGIKMIHAAATSSNHSHTHGRKKRRSIIQPTKHAHAPSPTQKILRLQNMVKKMPKAEQDLCE